MNVMPTPEVTALLRDAQWWRLAARLLGRPQNGWTADVRALVNAEAAPDLARAAAWAEAASEGDYLDALGPTGVVSPRETAHAVRADPGHLLAELRATYDAFAYRPSPDEPPDHVAVEADFVAFLRLKEAFARAQGDDEHAAVCADAARTFLEDHVRVAIGPVADRLAGSPLPHLYGAARAIADRVGPPPADSAGRIIWLAQDQDEEITCGTDVPA